MNIHHAAARGDTDAVRSELETGTSVNSVATVHIAKGGRGLDAGGNGFSMPLTPLMAATLSDQASPAMLRFLLDRGADPNIVTEMDPIAGKMSALLLAENSIQKLQLLLDAGADPNLPTPEWFLPIVNASRDCRFDAVRILLDRGANRSPLKWTNLMYAVVFGTGDDVMACLEEAPDLHARDHWDRTAWILSLCVGDLVKAEAMHAAGAGIHEAVRAMPILAYVVGNRHRIPEFKRVLQWLLANGIDVNRADNSGNTALLDVASEGDVAAARLLVEIGADINHVGGEGLCLLSSAADRGDIEMVKAALDMGADIECSNRLPALYAAVRRDHVEITRLLLDAGAKVNAGDPEYWTPLHAAKSVEVVELLLRQGADVHARNCVGDDPLMTHTNIEIQALLIGSGASVNPQGNFISTPLIRAVRDQDIARVSLLLRSDADPSLATKFGETALMAAAEQSSLDLLNLLLQAGADITARDHRGWTALFHAAAPEGCPAYFAYRMLKQAQVRRPKTILYTHPEITPLVAGMSAQIKNLSDQTLRRTGYVEADSVEVLQALVRAGLHLETEDAEGQTVLSVTAACGRPSRVRALLALGANPEACDAKGQTPRDYARQHPDETQRQDILSLL